MTHKKSGGLHLDVLPEATRRAFAAASAFNFLKAEGWYLAGGTALALQAGHRESVDLDFFTTEKDFEVERLERTLLRESDDAWKTTSSDAGTLYGLLQGAKTSFIAYPHFIPSAHGLQYGNMRILSADDIAVMKIIAVSQRGRKRDFIDLYWYCAIHGASLRDTILRVGEQYPHAKHSTPHLIKSLSYFADAEEDPQPQLHFKADWDEVKGFFRREVKDAAKELLGVA